MNNKKQENENQKKQRKPKKRKKIGPMPYDHAYFPNKKKHIHSFSMHTQLSQTTNTIAVPRNPIPNLLLLSAKAKQQHSHFFLQSPAKQNFLYIYFTSLLARLLPTSSVQQHLLFSTEVAQPNCRGE